MCADHEMKRLFWGLEVAAPWPTDLPPGRILETSSRHLTLAFLGHTDYTKMTDALLSIPPIPFKVGFVGKFNKCIFLPHRHPHVAAWHVEWWDRQEKLELFQHDLIDWIKKHDLPVDDKYDLLPHVTICRDPKNHAEWERTFMPLPLMTKDLHLYESIGNLKYQPCFSYTVKPPFEEVEHTADIAYKIRGENLLQLYRHAYTALAFKFPSLLDYPFDEVAIHNLDDIIISLNIIIGKVDQEKGCPFKAISFHGDIALEEDALLKWEMIVDV